MRPAPTSSSSSVPLGDSATRVKPSSSSSVGKPCERHLEDRTHRDADRPPVERVATRGVEQHGVDAECVGVAEDHAHVLVVVDALEHGDDLGLPESRLGCGRPWPRDRSQHSPVDVEPRDLVHDRLRSDVGRGWMSVDRRRQKAEREPSVVRDEERANRERRPHEALDDERPLGDAHLFSLDRTTECGVVQRAVLHDPRVVRIVDGRRCAHLAGSVARGAEVLTPRLRGAGGGAARLRRVTAARMVRSARRRRCAARQRALPPSRRHDGRAERVVARRPSSRFAAALRPAAEPACATAGSPPAGSASPSRADSSRAGSARAAPPRDRRRVAAALRQGRRPRRSARRRDAPARTGLQRPPSLT